MEHLPQFLKHPVARPWGPPAGPRIATMWATKLIGTARAVARTESWIETVLEILLGENNAG